MRKCNGYRVGSIYFIRCQGYVKIGWSDDVERRVDAMQTANPFSLCLLATIPNKTRVFEKTLHAQFAHLHWRGEWFKFEADLEDYVFRVANNCDYVPHMKGIVV